MSRRRKELPQCLEEHLPLCFGTGRVCSSLAAPSNHHLPFFSWKSPNIPFSRRPRMVCMSVLLFPAVRASSKTLPSQVAAMWLLQTYFLLKDDFQEQVFHNTL